MKWKSFSFYVVSHKRKEKNRKQKQQQQQQQQVEWNQVTNFAWESYATAELQTNNSL